jgi:hypothetical protein
MIEGSCHCGQVRWRFAGVPQSATACNCSVCRRWGALWAYDFENEKITVSGATQAYLWNRKWIEFHFCPGCACIAWWRAAMPGKDGRRRIAVNLRLASDPDAVKSIALIHHVTELRDDLPPDGKCVADLWA